MKIWRKWQAAQQPTDSQHRALLLYSKLVAEQWSDGTLYAWGILPISKRYEPITPALWQHNEELAAMACAPSPAEPSPIKKAEELQLFP